MADLIVVGAGVLGTSVAWRAAQAGAAVTLLDAGRVGGGTSQTSFAWTNANNKPPRPYHDLNAAGMRAHAALADELGATPWHHPSGCVEWASGETGRTALRQRVARLRAWGYAAEDISPETLRELEPDIDPAALEGAAAASFPEEGWLDPVAYAGAMARLAEGAGARVRTHTPVREIVRVGGRVVGVRTDTETIRAGVVVNCAGRWAADVAGGGELGIALAPTAGMVLMTPPLPVSVRRVVRSPDCHLRPDGAGRLMLVDDVDEFVPAPTPSLPAAAALMRRAAAVLPVLEGVAPEAVRVGVRSIPADGYSAVGPLPGVEGYYVAVTHSAVTMAALLGAVVADEVVRGRTDARLKTFRPARLVAGAW